MIFLCWFYWNTDNVLTHIWHMILKKRWYLYLNLKKLVISTSGNYINILIFQVWHKFHGTLPVKVHIKIKFSIILIAVRILILFSKTHTYFGSHLAVICESDVCESDVVLFQRQRLTLFSDFVFYITFECVFNIRVSPGHQIQIFCRKHKHFPKKNIFKNVCQF